MTCAAAIPSELNEDVAYRVGRAYADFVHPRRVIVGRDIRLSSEELVARAGAGSARFGRRRVRRGALRHRGRLLRDLLREDGRRCHGYGQPQPPGLQRHEVRPRGIAAHQRRQRAAGHPSHRGGGALRHARPHRRAVRDGRDAGLHRAPAVLRRYGEAQAPQGGRSCRQRRRRTDRRQAAALPAVRVHQGAARARRQLSRTACRTRCWSRTTVRRSRRCGRIARTWPCPGTATTTAASFSTSAASSSRATTSWACSPSRSCGVIPAQPSSTIRGSPGTPSTS